MKQSKLLKKDYSKSSQGTNKPVVRDSNWSSVSALTRLIILAIFMMPVFLCNIDVSATSGSMTVTISDTTVDLNVSPSTNGTFAKSDATTIGVSTTNATGYTLSISANSSSSSNPTSLINNTDNTKMFPSITSSITEEQFKSLNPSSMAYNNMWGYLPSKHCSNSTSSSCAVNTDFLPSPNINGDILDVTNKANTTINEYELTVGARVDTTATLGTYSNVFVVDVVANAVPYTIIFDDNVVDNMPTDLSGETDDSTITLPSNIPTRDGYTFIAWCTVKPTTTNGVDACTGGISYNAGALIPVDQTGGSNDYHLYSMWSKNKSIDDLTYMQDFNTLSSTDKTSVINLMQEGKGYYLMDNRDREVYMLAKLKDGRVWMLDNLRLGGTSSIALNSSNTNSNGNFTLPAGITSGFNSYTAPQINVAYKSDIATHYGQGSGKVGVYYNYCAASAGTICTSSNTNNANYDICPAGWRLPTTGLDGVGEYGSLCSTYYGFTCGSWQSGLSPTNINSPNYNFSDVRSGLFYGNTQQSLGKGRFWSSSHYNGSSYDNNVSMFILYLEGGAFNTGDFGVRDNGLSARCILK